jgi:hypothetical protein
MFKEGKSAWKIVTELFPHIKGSSPDFLEGTEGTEGREEEEEEEKKERDACAILRKVERAIERANVLIESINPTE